MQIVLNFFFQFSSHSLMKPFQSAVHLHHYHSWQGHQCPGTSVQLDPVVSSHPDLTSQQHLMAHYFPDTLSSLASGTPLTWFSFCLIGYFSEFFAAFPFLSARVSQDLNLGLFFIWSYSFGDHTFILKINILSLQLELCLYPLFRFLL